MRKRRRALRRIGILIGIPIMLLTACVQSKQEDFSGIAKPEDIKAVEPQHYRVVKARTGTFTISYDEKVSITSRKEILRWSNESDHYGEIYVTVGEKVVKGQVLATMQITGASESEKMAAQFALEEAEVRLDILQTQKESVVAAKRETMKDLESYEYEYARIELGQLISQYDQQIAAAERSVKSAEEQIERIRELEESGRILAPFDGVVTKVSNQFIQGKIAKPYEDLFEVEDPNTRLFYFETHSAYGIPPYMSRADITSRDGAYHFTGTVVANPYVGAVRMNVGGSRTPRYASVVIIKPDGLIDNVDVFNYMKASGYVLEAPDVVLVNADAVYRQGDHYYVYIDRDGTPTKNFIKIAGDYRGNVWVTEGLSEGETVYIMEK